MGPICTVLFALVIIGFILWLINNYIPIQPPFKQVINVVVVILLIVWLVSKFFPSILHF